ncbi:cupin domain-containing protein [Guptibacillus hwajinpoensis]|uniref:cupin domain-containing protein n=1 Tax=Guptibacillus hwajinpoensis TaxID=208199 RepID=UPI001CD47E52|nr:cupin domain-containing protein [Pseudalkalibacillus hwajinpoensis]MCA0989777.1 cupin domain-containing protein [Pseudalkalibacillus hwajinpoensis]
MKKEMIKTLYFDDDGKIPNNAFYPLTLYHAALENRDAMALFNKNKWTNAWQNGVFPYHHYHSNTHEVLGIVKGDASITFGGEKGETIRVEEGDVVVIPAGVGHKREQASSDFLVVGAYPDGRDHDLRTGEPNERPTVLKNIQNVPVPEFDPIFGVDGPLKKSWTKQ